MLQTISKNFFKSNIQFTKMLSQLREFKYILFLLQLNKLKYMKEKDTYVVSNYLNELSLFASHSGRNDCIESTDSYLEESINKTHVFQLPFTPQAPNILSEEDKKRKEQLRMEQSQRLKDMAEKKRKERVNTSPLYLTWVSWQKKKKNLLNYRKSELSKMMTPMNIRYTPSIKEVKWGLEKNIQTWIQIKSWIHESV